MGADLLHIMNDMAYVQTMEMMKNQQPIVTKKIELPDPSVRNIMKKYLEKTGQLSFEKVFVQKLGFLFFKEFCRTYRNGSCPQVIFYEAIQEYEKMETPEERLTKAQEIYDNNILPEILNHAHPYSKATLQQVQRYLLKNNAVVDLFKSYVSEIFDLLRGETFQKFLESKEFTRFCQWKNFELNMQLTMDDFMIYRTLGRGGFGLVSGVRKIDTGKMFAMKCMEKKRLKMNEAEAMAINERIVLSLASTGDYCPFIVGMTYAFHTADQLVFLLDVMTGGDLEYHLDEHGVFKEQEMKFYAGEILLGLEHMHSRFLVYRDLKPANILLEETGHIRISDLGLACDFSGGKVREACGTPGYIAPEILKGREYDCSCDWFSFGCMMFVLMFKRPPFKGSSEPAKSEDEVFKMSLNELDLPMTLSADCKDLLEQLLKHDVDKRLGCKGRGPAEIKEHAFFQDIDWQRMFWKRYTPPIVPPKNYINALPQHEIPTFSLFKRELKGIKITKEDDNLYKNFNITISERWQQEIAESVFERVNTETDKVEEKKRKSKKVSSFFVQENNSDVIIHGYVKRLGGPFATAWQMRYGKLYPSRLELHSESNRGKPELYFMDKIEDVDRELQEIKGEKCVVVRLKHGQDAKLVLTTSDEISLKEWHTSLRTALKVSIDLLQQINPKAMKIYGINRDPMLMA